MMSLDYLYYMGVLLCFHYTRTELRVREVLEMPVKKKEFTFDELEIEARQASGLEKLPFESILSKAFRKFRHFGLDQSIWTEEQTEEFMDHVEELGGGMQDQMMALVPPCILNEGFDINSLTIEELREIFLFVRGGDVGDEDGAAPLDQ
tara:strand:+ start:93 stop:539 length:447 start_codon:yes stop_codon:yes gene_type:complete